MTHIDDTDPHHCELHDWQHIGRVRTDNGTLALVAPYYSTTFDRWWDQRLDTIRTDRIGNFEQVTLRRHDGYDDAEAAFLVSCDNGGYDVHARFCDEYGTGHLTICELRISLHYHEDEDEDEEA